VATVLVVVHTTCNDRRERKRDLETHPVEKKGKAFQVKNLVRMTCKSNLLVEFEN